MAHEAAERAGAEGPAREAEDEDLVAGIVVEDKEAIGLSNVGHQPDAHGAARHPIERPGAYALVVMDNLGWAAIGYLSDYAGGSEDYIGGRVSIQPVPRAVETKNQPLH